MPDPLSKESRWPKPVLRDPGCQWDGVQQGGGRYGGQKLMASHPPPALQTLSICQAEAGAGGGGGGGGLGQGFCWPLPIHTRHPGSPFGAQAGAAQDVRPQPGELCPALPGKRTPGPPPFTPSTKSGAFSRDPLEQDSDPDFPRLIPRPAPTSCPTPSRLSEKPGLLSLSSARVPPPGRP